MNLSVKSFHDYLQAVCCLKVCPVCFLQFHCVSKKQFICMDCSSSASLMYCLVCGYVGCTNKVTDHARIHYLETSHCYFAELKYYKVWDFEMRYYVHDAKMDGSQPLDFLTLNTTVDYVGKCSCCVCLYKKTPRMIRNYTCMECNVSKLHLLRVCLTCGHVGCFKGPEFHAYKHYITSGHVFAVQMDNFKVWDYQHRKPMKLQIHLCEPRGNVGDCIKTQYFFEPFDNSEPGDIPRISEFMRLNNDFARREYRLDQQLKEIIRTAISDANNITPFENQLHCLRERADILKWTSIEQTNKINDLMERCLSSMQPVSDSHNFINSAFYSTINVIIIFIFGIVLLYFLVYILPNMPQIFTKLVHASKR